MNTFLSKLIKSNKLNFSFTKSEMEQKIIFVSLMVILAAILDLIYTLSP